MRTSLDQSRVLFFHFFRRFFDNDTIRVEGDTTTTIARAIGAVAAPGLLVAFFLQNQYPKRSLWGRIEDQYFFVLLSFVMMGAVTIFEWEMLFPDRIDFLVLTPLPLLRKQLMESKALALACFLLVFLVGSNCLGALVFPVICLAPIARQMFAHIVAVGLAGTFSSCAVLAAVALIRCCLPDRLFRLATPLLQGILTAVLVLLVIQYARYGESIHALALRPTVARWIPTIWFLAVYDHLLYGSTAPSFAADLCSRAYYACGGSVALVLLLYPVTWARMHKMSIEGSLSRTGSRSDSIRRLIDAGVRQPAERAMFHFLGQTIVRNPRYQVYLAMYAGTGFSLALACAFGLRSSPAGLAPTASIFGGHAVVPLLVFWAVAGLHTAFAFPTTLSARWVFRVSGVDSRALVAGAAKWTILVTMLVWSASLWSISRLGWSGRALLVQIAFGMCLAILLTDAFFVGRRIPLIEPRLPGRTNFALYLTLYIGVLTPAIFCIIWSELRIERSPWMLIPFCALTFGCHLVFQAFLRTPMEEEEWMEGYEGEFQLLNLS
jgi:hypothetical protein